MPTVSDTLIAIRDGAEVNRLAFEGVIQQLEAQRVALAAMPSGSAKNSMVDRLERHQARLANMRDDAIALRDAAAREAVSLGAALPPLPLPPAGSWSTDQW